MALTGRWESQSVWDPLSSHHEIYAAKWCKTSRTLRLRKIIHSCSSYNHLPCPLAPREKTMKSFYLIYKIGILIPGGQLQSCAWNLNWKATAYLPSLCAILWFAGEKLRLLAEKNLRNRISLLSFGKYFLEFVFLWSDNQMMSLKTNF